MKGKNIYESEEMKTVQTKEEWQRWKAFPIKTHTNQTKNLSHCSQCGNVTCFRFGHNIRLNRVTNFLLQIIDFLLYTTCDLDLACASHLIMPRLLDNDLGVSICWRIWLIGIWQVVPLGALCVCRYWSLVSTRQGFRLSIRIVLWSLSYYTWSQGHKVPAKILAPTGTLYVMVGYSRGHKTQIAA